MPRRSLRRPPWATGSRATYLLEFGVLIIHSRLLDAYKNGTKEFAEHAMQEKRLLQRASGELHKLARGIFFLEQGFFEKARASG